MSRWTRALQTSFVSTLILLLGLGHACEFPLFAGAVAAAEANDEHHDHHDHDATDPGSSDGAHLASCDGLVAARHVTTTTESLHSYTAITPFRTWVVVADSVAIMAAAPIAPPPGRPRFLLLSILLI